MKKKFTCLLSPSSREVNQQDESLSCAVEAAMKEAVDAEEAAGGEPLDAEEAAVEVEVDAAEEGGLFSFVHQVFSIRCAERTCHKLSIVRIVIHKWSTGNI